ncbi:hypothetical protein [Armatimonas sp.]|uniref:hypothetical protein n=1 Tax=Armatimonas sp. TaxID=1872638 RepID=UPI0037512527
MALDFRYPSPDDRYGFRISSWEARMSHWIESAELIEVSTEEHVFSFSDTNWSLDNAVWDSPSVVRLTVRKYPGNHTPPDFTVVLDCEAKTVTVDGVPVAKPHLVESYLDEQVRKGRQKPKSHLPG